MQDISLDMVFRRVQSWRGPGSGVQSWSGAWKWGGEGAGLEVGRRPGSGAGRRPGSGAEGLEVRRGQGLRGRKRAFFSDSLLEGL